MRMENMIEILEKLDYIYAIDGMGKGRIHSHLMLGTHSFRKHRDVGRGHTEGATQAPYTGLCLEWNTHRQYCEGCNC